ncbi:MAG: trigger factor family protein [Candidatus Dependentiae bacterium]|nr:trigger factor family protein [Candidatus Dependentiae bacterium]
MEIVLKQVCEQALSFELHQQTASLWYVHIDAPQELVTFIYHEAVKSLQREVHATGFTKGAVPFEYVEKNLKSTLTSHVKDFLLSFCITSYLYNELRNRKIVIAGAPRLHAIDIALPNHASFTFELSTITPITLHDWKYFAFKAPKRKNYKDLDRQVELFIKEEKDNLKNTTNTNIDVGDWVCCDIALADQNNQPILTQFVESLWIKLGDEEADAPLRDIFINKELHSQFISQSPALQDYFSSHVAAQHNFIITIKDIVKNSFFCLEEFKRHFKLKTNKDLNLKLIEVFSYRNDLSLRRTMAEETLKLMLTKHKFDAPLHTVLRQQQQLLNSIQMNPDYHVYRVQKDFKASVKQLAEKQAKEALLIDHIAYQDNILIGNNDIKSYLSLTQRPRMKEFIYFDPIPSKQLGREIPLPSYLLKQICLREKTLNHVIHYLTQK